MKTKLKFLILSLGIVMSAATSCSDDDENEYPGIDKKGIQLRNTDNFGTILTSKDGRTLYFFSNDADGTSKCSGNCEVTWPVYYSPDASTDENIDPKDIGVITRADGKKQNTYKGFPLYTYSQDTKIGDINGDAVGGIWFVGKPDYTLMIVNNQLTGADGNKYKSDYTPGEGVTSYFTNGAGRTVYAFTPDKFNVNTYTKPDFSNDAVWPIYQTDVQSLPSVIRKADLGVIDVFGKKQLTYKGHPLYYFGQDTRRGENKGVSVPKPGVWPVVNLATTEAPRQ
jgi:predicted lipoprotein with Yx(FWY)xxD motif